MLKAYIESKAFMPPTPATYDVNDPRFSWVRVGTGDVRIPVYFVSPPGVAIAERANYLTIVYSHGNAEDLGGMVPLVEELASRLMVHVCAYDYLGYGPARAGRCSEKGNYASIEAVIHWLEKTQRIPISNMILYGRSLGSGAAVHAAVRFPAVRGVVLQSAFLSAARVVVNLSVFDRMLGDIFINQNKIGHIACPVCLIHGLKDEVIPFAHCEALYKLCKHPATPLHLPNAGHNDIEQFFLIELLEHLQMFLTIL